MALALGLAGCLAHAASAQTPSYSRLIIFGDSLSDTGNDADVSDDKYDVRVPGPGPRRRDQLHRRTLHQRQGHRPGGHPARRRCGTSSWPRSSWALPAATASLDGGFDYAYGGATTEDGTRELDFTGGIGITVNNMGQQVSDYLAKYPAAEPAALYIVWGGANDIFVSATDAASLILTGKQAAKREAALITRLADAGAVNFLVPNLPPIGNTPRYNTSMGDIAAYNNASLAFVDRLPKQLAKVTAAFAAKGVMLNLKTLDVYGVFQRLLANQQAYNLYNITDSAQGESVKADNYLFWDDVHPTTSGHYQLAVEAYTTLTGKPLVQVAPDFTADGFYLTRSGSDLSEKLVVPYTIAGTGGLRDGLRAAQGPQEHQAGRILSAGERPGHRRQERQRQDGAHGHRGRRQRVRSRHGDGSAHPVR